ncbi:MAG TPA: endolytic transglycosylase MltG [Segeticoccus sp.]|nr:endolytic transglycosylase MltG [Segeticoccus sp.]
MTPSDSHLERSLFGDTGDPQEPGRPSDDLPPAGDDGAGDPHGDDGARDDEEPPRRRPRRRGRRWIALLVTLAVVVGAAGFALLNLVPAGQQIVAKLTESNDYTGTGHGHTTVVVHPGDTGTQIAQTLVDQGVIKSTNAFSEAAAQNPDAAAIQPGTYQLRKKMSATSAISMLLDPANRQVRRVTIPEGLRAEEVFARLAKGTKHSVKDYEKAARKARKIGLPARAKGEVEGFLFPATYDFQPKQSATDQLSTMVDKAVAVLNEEGVAASDRMRVLTIASLVEAEARRPQDRPKVARVILNRLKKGMPLQMDSTVHYIAGSRGKAGTTDKQRRAKSPYNTYRHAGLPPGPIDSPGKKSIDAAVHPAPGKWLYFVTVNPTTGKTKFAATLSQHDQNVKEFQAWCSRHADKC